MTITTAMESSTVCRGCRRARAEHRGAYHTYEPTLPDTDAQVLMECQCGVEARTDERKLELEGLGDALRGAGWQFVGEGWRCPKCVERIERRLVRSIAPGQTNFLNLE